MGGTPVVGLWGRTPILCKILATVKNFTKFLINRQGEVVGRFEPKVKPDSPEMVQAIEKELDKK
jgi:glutathione peroxidase-family protein